LVPLRRWGVGVIASLLLTFFVSMAPPTTSITSTPRRRLNRNAHSEENNSIPTRSSKRRKDNNVFQYLVALFGHRVLLLGASASEKSSVLHSMLGTSKGAVSTIPFVWAGRESPSSWLYGRWEYHSTCIPEKTQSNMWKSWEKSSAMMDRSIQSSIIGEDPIRRPTFGNFDRVVPHLYWMTMDYLPLAIFLQFNLKWTWTLTQELTSSNGRRKGH
jgi:hypothetical protein